VPVSEKSQVVAGEVANPAEQRRRGGRGGRPALSAMGATVRGSNTGTTTSVGDSLEESDSSGRPRAPWGVILSILILSSSAGVAGAQTVPLPPPVEEVTDTVDDIVDEVKEDVGDKTKAVNKLKKRASREAKKTTRDAERTTDAIRQGDAADETEVQTRASPRAQDRDKKQRDRKNKRRNTTAQEGNSRGDENEDGDVNTLVDAGNEIEGAQVESAQPAPEPTERRESLPLTGFDPRALTAMGFGLIAAGVLLLVSYPSGRGQVPERVQP
jgi:hypothetical protein